MLNKYLDLSIYGQRIIYPALVIAVCGVTDLRLHSVHMPYIRMLLSYVVCQLAYETVPTTDI